MQDEKRLYVSAKWYETGCYVTIAQAGASISIALVLNNIEEITQLVDTLVVAANSKPEEKKDAK